MPHHHRHHQRQRDGPHHPVNQDESGEVEARQVQPEAATIIPLVYMTASQTFDGSAVYTIPAFPSTIQSKPEDTPISVQVPAAVKTTTLQLPTPVAASSILSALQPHSSLLAVVTSSATALSGIASSSSDTLQISINSVSSSGTTSLLHPIQTTTNPALVIATPTQFVQSTTNPAVAASATQASNSGSGPVTENSPKGLTGGAKAGIAIGIILAIAALLALIAFCYRRRSNSRRAAQERVEDEKNPFGDNAATHTAPRTLTLPRLSLKHMTQFDSKPNDATKNGNAPAMATPTIATASQQDIENGQDRGGQPPNPFDEHTVSSNFAVQDHPLKRDSSMLAQQVMPAPLRIRTPTPESATVAGLVAGAASATIAQRHNAPKPLDIKRAVSPAPRDPIEAAVPSPVPTEFSMTSTSPGSMTGGDAPLRNVHRIQLDFNPSMEDELELRAGQLVRLLHEYDDGWALCIRLDRSQQGVAPRTCLSTRPVKPRSNGPPRGPPAPGMPRSPEQRSISPSGLGSPKSLSRPPRSAPPGPNRGQRSKSPRAHDDGPQIQSASPPGVQRGSNSVSHVHENNNSPVRPSPVNSTAGAVAQGMQDGVHRVSMLLQTVTPPALTPPQTPHSMQRKPVAGQVA